MTPHDPLIRSDVCKDMRTLAWQRAFKGTYTEKESGGAERRRRSAAHTFWILQPHTHRHTHTHKHRREAGCVAVRGGEVREKTKVENQNKIKKWGGCVVRGIKGEKRKKEGKTEKSPKGKWTNSDSTVTKNCSYDKKSYFTLLKRAHSYCSWLQRAHL